MIQLDARLRSAAEFVPAGAKMLDVGCDHAYLPIVLCREGKIRSAVATDINEGPLEAARLHIAEAGLASKIETRLCDGIRGLETEEPNVITICGMGGELIAAILAEAPWIRTKKITLVLQPMTHAHDLRAWLAANGFGIKDEKISYTDRLYQTICACFTGRPYTLTLPELYYGKKNIERGGTLFSEWMREQQTILLRKMKARATAGEPVSAETELLSFIENELKGARNDSTGVL